MKLLHRRNKKNPLAERPGINVTHLDAQLVKKRFFKVARKNGLDYNL